MRWRPWSNTARWIRFNRALDEMEDHARSSVYREDPDYWRALVAAAAIAQEILDDLKRRESLH